MAANDMPTDGSSHMRWLIPGLLALAAGCASVKEAEIVEEPEILAQGGGIVRVSCAAASDGNLHDCRILSERPTGRGLGDVALRAAERSRVDLEGLMPSSLRPRVEYNILFRPENMPHP